MARPTIVHMTGATPPYVLTAIVPVSRMGGRLGLLFSWIPEALSSRIKVILVHDFRDDQTSRELKDFVRTQESVALMLIEDTFGAPGLARNAGLRYVESKWVAFWDSDDLPLIRVVTSEIEAVDARNENEKVIVGAFKTIDVARPEESKEFFFRASNSSWVNQLPAMPGLWRFVIDKSLLRDEAFSSLRMGEDQLLIEELLKELKSFHFYNEIAYCYYVGNTFQATRNTEALQDLNPLVLKSIALYTDAQTDTRRLLVPYLGRQVLSNLKYLGLLNGVSLIEKIVSNFGIMTFVRLSASLFTLTFNSKRIPH